MTVKERVHALVDELPEPDLLTLERQIRGLLAPPVDPPLAALANAPEDDEPETEEERAAVAEAWEAHDRGEGIPHEEMLRRTREPAARCARPSGSRLAVRPVPEP